LHIGPSFIHFLLEGNELVVTSAAAKAEEQDHKRDSSEGGDKFFHSSGSRPLAREKRRQSDL
jgi:hypothetical protein